MFCSFLKLHHDDYARNIFSCLKNSDGSLDALELLSALAVFSRGKFEDKAKAVFSLFDFDDNHFLEKHELVSMVKTSVCGLCKLCAVAEPPHDALMAVAEKAYDQCLEYFPTVSHVEKHQDEISVRGFVEWVVISPSASGMLEKHNTQEGVGELEEKYRSRRREHKERVKQKALDNKRDAAARLQRIKEGLNMNKKERLSDKGRGGVKKRDASKRQKLRVHLLVQAQEALKVFKSIDKDDGGTISLQELSESLQSSSRCGTGPI